MASQRRPGSPPIADRVTSIGIRDRGGVLSTARARDSERRHGRRQGTGPARVPPTPSGGPETRRVDRLVLPSDIESTEGVTRTLRPFIEGTALDEVIADGASLWERPRDRIDVLRASTRSTPMGSSTVPSSRRTSSSPPPGGRGSSIRPCRSRSRPAPSAGTRDRGPRYRPRKRVSSIGASRRRPLRPLFGRGVMFGVPHRPSPVRRDGPGALLRHMESPCSIREGVDAPRVLDEIIGRLLRKDPTDRYATSASVLHDLMELERRRDAANATPGS